MHLVKLLILAVWSRIQVVLGVDCDDSGPMTIAVKGESETTFPVSVSCKQSSGSYNWDINDNVRVKLFESCSISNPEAFAKYDIDAKTGTLFYFKGKFYVLRCFYTGGPDIEVAVDNFSKWVLSAGNSKDWNTKIPVDDAEDGRAIQVFFDHPFASSDNIAKCFPLGENTDGFKAGSTGVFVKDKSSYWIECFKKTAPKLRKANFIKDVCGDGKKKAKVEVSGKETPIKSVCVSFSCNATPEITKCTPECKTFGTDIVVDKPGFFTKDNKKYKLTCMASGPPSVTYIGPA